MPIERTGGCQCGATRYRTTGEPRAVTVCHCSDCQQQSGSAFGMSAIFARSDFRVETGTSRMFSKTAESGRTVECGFCADCGNRIFHLPELNPDVVNVKAGTFDDRSWCIPVIHVWTSSKQPWVEIPADVPQFPRNPGD